MNVVSVVGARPEFIQAMPVSQALRAANHTEILVHTGQHYDYEMSQTFFDELGIPAPDYNLEVGSGRHGQQTADILNRFEVLLLQEQPDWVIIRGDTNSTVAAGLAAAKLHIPTAHIEAGERSYDRRMPEEINRLVADCLSTLHLCASQTAVERLAAEGIKDTVFWVGDVMLDALIVNLPIARQQSSILTRLELLPKSFSLVTVHRAANTEDPQRLKQIIEALNQVKEPIIFPVHPRTRQALNALEVDIASHVMLIEPVGYFDMVVLEENSRLIATDSGGVQREAYFLSIPCLTLREETEWIETVNAGWNHLVGVSPAVICEAWQNIKPPDEHPPIFGDGKAAQRIVQFLEETTFVSLELSLIEKAAGGKG